MKQAITIRIDPALLASNDPGGKLVANEEWCDDLQERRRSGRYPAPGLGLAPWTAIGGFPELFVRFGVFQTDAWHIHATVRAGHQADRPMVVTAPGQFCNLHVGLRSPGTSRQWHNLFHGCSLDQGRGRFLRLAAGSPSAYALLVRISGRLPLIGSGQRRLNGTCFKPTRSLRTKELAMGLASYEIVGNDADWRVRHDGKAENAYETKEAAFEAAVTAASLAMRQGHAVSITAPSRGAASGAHNT
jgi:hypothetical protein